MLLSQQPEIQHTIHNDDESITLVHQTRWQNISKLIQELLLDGDQFRKSLRL
jgi:hypothetical protein